MNPTSNYALLVPPSLKSTVASWLEEDIPSFDVGGAVVGATPAKATLWCKATGVLAGVPWVNEIFRQVDCM
jgi:nicotinate-nucleotide pyrophosphorylase (carboxylating)